MITPLSSRGSEDCFSSAFQYASIGMALLAPDGSWLKVNRSLCDLVGYSEEDLLSKTFQDITHPADLDADLENVRKLLAGEIVSYEMEKRYFHKLGRLVWVLLSVSLLRDAEGQPLTFISQIQDITGRKKTESELETTHRQLLDSSRRAGMAEAATGVLHNVGNVLNSVNVAATVVTDRLKKSEHATLVKVVALLREHESDLGTFLSADPKGRRIPEFLAMIAGHWSAEQAHVVGELALLRKNIEHIKDVIAMQQGYAKVSGATQTVNVADLLDDTVRLDADSLAGSNVELVRECKDVPALTVDKHKLLQILVNLLRNAKHACADSGRADKKVTLRVVNGNGSVKISVSDNGIGIPPENLARIFNHGFTTKNDGHGFGLHSGALAAREMGGALLVHSDGAGRGATFTVELPINSQSPTQPPARTP